MRGLLLEVVRSWNAMLKVVALFILALSVFACAHTLLAESGSLDIDARVPGCGDDIVDIGLGEECDNSDLNGRNCGTEGFTAGTLTCTISCLLNVSACTMSSGGGGGGGSSSGGSRNGSQVVLTGRAYPGSTVTILKDAQIVATAIADASARFQVSVKGLAAGSYIFSLYSEDDHGVRSSLLSFPVSLTKSIVAKLDSIFIAPTIATDKREVRRGDPIAMFGQSVPESEITIEVNSENQIFVKTPSDDDGAYLYTLDSSVLEFGDHHARSRASSESTISSLSSSVGFKVGLTNIPAEPTSGCVQRADLNGDCRVNLIDFSIAAFWYRRAVSDQFRALEAVQLNGDGVVTIVDFSIMAYYWTG